MSIILNAFRSRRIFRIWLVRHGESMGNVNPSIYRTTPDHKIPLTERGMEMAKSAGQHLAEHFQRIYETPDQMGHCRMWVSPFKRTRQTAQGILDVAGDWVNDVRESPFLVEQDWGLFEGSGMQDAPLHYPDEWQRLQRLRDHQGKFWARMPMGESCFDVCTRVSSLFGTITRDRLTKVNVGREVVDNIIVVSHGVTIRAFVTMWCHYSPEWFEVNDNPPNCSVLYVEDNAVKRYVFAGYDQKGGSLSLDDLPIVPDPTAVVMPKKSSAKSTPVNSYEWSEADTTAAIEFFRAIDEDGNGRLNSEEAVLALGAHNNLLGSGLEVIDLDGFLTLLKEEAKTISPPVPYKVMLEIATRTKKGEITRSEAQEEYIREVRARYPAPPPLEGLDF
mmetsp:Transcript_20880/g.51186  ORF Transcript_20880/g.51186 Transcript_20880/m.51186 type:complete len:390 (+) Transcript_20880:353-1522(+)